MISASDLAAWEFCPRKVYFQRVLGIRSPKKEEMIKGTIKHKIFEEMINSHKKKESFDISNIIENALSRYTKDFEEFSTDVDGFKKELESCFSILREKVNKKEFLIPEFCEQWMESEDLALKARIDTVFNESGDWIIGDLKTNTSDFLGTQLQVGAGALVFEKKMNTKVKKMKIISHNDWEEKKIYLTNELRKKILETRDEVREMLKNKKMPPTCSNINKCSKCNFWDSHCNPEMKSRSGN